MGLTLRVGGVKGAFVPSLSDRVEVKLRRKFGLTFPTGLDQGQVFYSDDLGWSWWKMFQDFASETIGQEHCANLTSIDAWAGGFLPLEIQPTTVTMGFFERTSLQLASLPGLWRELESLSSVASLPFTPETLQQFLAHYRNHPEFSDDDPALQTYANLVLCGFAARESSAAIWLIK